MKSEENNNWMDLFGDEDDNDREEEDSNNDSNNNKENNSIISFRKVLGIGGERGVFAEIDIEPGQLILAEKPCFTWSNEDDFSNSNVLKSYCELICKTTEAYEVSKFLYPCNLEIIDEEEVNRIKELFNITNLNEYNSELIRVALVLQHNGFSSGLYKYLSLINHSCIPNCIKFSPNKSNLNNWKNVSEIWSIQPIKAGEEITICYCDKIEIPYLSMRSYLFNQHRFLCNCSRCISLQNNNSNRNNSNNNNNNNIKYENYLESILSSLELNDLLFDIDQFPINYSKKGSKYFDLTDYEEILSQSEFLSKSLHVILYIKQIINEILQFQTNLTSSLSLSLSSSTTLTTTVLSLNPINLIENNSNNFYEYLLNYDNLDLEYIISRFHQVIIVIVVKVIEYIYESSSSSQSNSFEFDEKVILEIFCFVCELYIKHTFSLYYLQCNYLKFPKFYPLVGETLSHILQSLQTVLNISSLFPSIKNNNSKDPKYNVLLQLYNENPTIFFWANSKSLVKSEIQKYNEQSQIIHNMYQLSYEVLQQNLKSQINIISYE